jgi:hypothetical protein
MHRVDIGEALGSAGKQASKRNILGGIWVHPQHLNLDRSFLVHGRLLAVHFQDRVIRAVRLEFSTAHVVRTVRFCTAL